MEKCNHRCQGHEPEVIHIEVSREEKNNEHRNSGTGDNLLEQDKRTMSPLTIETNFQQQFTQSIRYEDNRRHVLHSDLSEGHTRTHSTPSPFYYSQSEGPLKSPGIFVPYADDKTRERLEHAIREVFEKNVPTYKPEILQPFPLQDPPRSKFKRQISTDSNESIDNRLQKYPSKKPQNANTGTFYDSIPKPRSLPIYSDHDQTGQSRINSEISVENVNRKTHDDELPYIPQKRQDLVDGSEVNVKVTSHVVEKDSPALVNVPLTTPSSVVVCQNTTKGRQAVTAQGDYIKRSLISKCSINIPETPYTKNLEWVVSDPSPNSLHDFIPATPTVIFTEASPSSAENVPRSSASESTSRRDFKTYEYNHPCSNEFNSDFHNEAFNRDAVPVCTSSTVSDMNNSKVTEKGFVFPDKSRITDPILLSPRIASDKLCPHFESTPKKIDASSSRNSCVSIEKQYSDTKFVANENESNENQYFADQVYKLPSNYRQELRPHTFSPSKSSPYNYNQKESYPRDIRMQPISPLGDRHSTEKGTPLKSPSKASLYPDFERPRCSWERSPNRQNFENQERPRFIKGNNRESVSELMMDSFNSTLSRSTSHSNHYSSNPTERANGYRKVTGLLQCTDQTGDEYNGSEHERYKIVREMLRPYSMIELSPSKSDIDRVREKVRKIYRSLSSPIEMKQMLKNLLIEERMKEEFSVDDVFEDSFTSAWSTTSTSRHARGTFYQGNYLGYNEMPHPDARRRLFEERQNDDCVPRLYSKGGNQRLDYADAKEARIDLTDILGEMYRERIQELQEEEFGRNPQYVDESGPRNIYRGTNTSPGRLSNRYQIGGEASLLPDREYDCNMPGCSHTQTRIQRDMNRKRKLGDLEVHVSCEDDDVSNKSRSLQSALKKVEHSGGKNCSCANIESAILDMARNAYQKIRRMDSSEYSFDRFNNEASETRDQIFDSVRVLCGIKSMCKYGRIIEDMFTGSIIFIINSPTLLALEDLWSMYISGELRTVFNNTFITDKLKEKFDCMTAKLKVNISKRDYERARRELKPCGIKSPKMNTSLSKSDTEISSVCSSSKENYTFERSPRKKVKPSALAIIHMRSQSAPSSNQSPSPSPLCLSPLSNSPFSKDRKFSFSNINENSPRKAFQEINPVSPSTKQVFDFDVNITSKFSPKRKTFGELPPWENKNVQHGTSPKRRSIRD